MKINNQPVSRGEYKAVCSERDEFKVMHDRLRQRVREYEDETDTRQVLIHIAWDVVTLLAFAGGVLLGRYFFTF